MMEEVKNRVPPCPCQSGDARWTLIRFSVLCLLAILILITVHVRSSGPSSHGGHTSDLYGVGDAIFTRDLWLIIELPSDSLGLRTSLGKSSIEHVCGAVRAGQAVGWTPLVIGGKATCCRSHHCHHLAPTDIPKMNHSISKHYLRSMDDVTTALRTAGFLQAIEKGAHFIFHASPEVYYTAGIPPESYSAELERQLRRMTLGISIGLLSAQEGPLDPYAHFGRPSDSQVSYKICELRPPSLEKFLESDGSSTDVQAPPLTVSGGPRSPFDSRNTLFSRDAFLTLPILPGLGSLDPETEEGKRETAFLRAILAQALLRVLAGSTKFSISVEPLSFDQGNKTRLSPELSKIQNLLLNWDCSGGRSSAFRCMKKLLAYVADETGLLGPQHLEMADRWLSDLASVGYTDFPSIPSASPCIGSDSLPGVQFQASLPHSPEGSLARLCPSIDFSKPSSSSSGVQGSRSESLLLIISFIDSPPDYGSIGLFETVYRPAFQNILYCGPPGQGAEELGTRLWAQKGESFSFLPVSSGQGYECALGAIQMGYNVDGFLVVNARTFLISWSYGGLNPDVIWHGNEHAEVLDAGAISHVSEPSKKSKIIKSVHGLVETFNFLKKVLDSANPGSAGHNKTALPHSGGEGEGDVTIDYPLDEEEKSQQEEEEPPAKESAGEHQGLHLNIFGEINEAGGNSTNSLQHVNKNLTELIFHPANFKVPGGPSYPSASSSGLSSHIAADLRSLGAIYKSILVKLEAIATVEEESCAESLNPEICRLVSTFFRVLRDNDGEEFHLIYDDLPIYYVPLKNMYKDELYLMANLFTKYSVDNEIAFPLLLRGLSVKESWVPLKRSFLVNKSISIDSLEDLLSGAAVSPESEESHLLSDLESAHYIYPVNMTSVLRNEAIKNMICKRLQ